jgi:hypothetical protein
MGSYHLGTLLMNNQLNEYIDKDGKLYRYDPDYDCYYRVFTRDEYADLPHWDKHSWIYVIVALCAIAYYVEFLY